MFRVHIKIKQVTQPKLHASEYPVTLLSLLVLAGLRNFVPREAMRVTFRKLRCLWPLPILPRRMRRLLRGFLNEHHVAHSTHDVPTGEKVVPTRSSFRHLCVTLLCSNRCRRFIRRAQYFFSITPGVEGAVEWSVKLFPRFTSYVLRKFHEFCSVMIPPRIFIPMLVRRIMRCLLPFRNILIKSTKRETFHPINRRRFERDNMTKKRRPFFPITFGTSSVPCVIRMDLNPLLLMNRRVNSFLQTRPWTSKLLVRGNLRYLRPVYRIRTGLNAYGKGPFMICVRFPSRRNVRRTSPQARTSRVLRTIVRVSKILRARFVVIRVIHTRRHVTVLRGIRVGKRVKASRRFRDRHIALLLTRRTTTFRRLRLITICVTKIVVHLVSVRRYLKRTSVTTTLLRNFPVRNNRRIIVTEVVC